MTRRLLILMFLLCTIRGYAQSEQVIPFGSEYASIPDPEISYFLRYARPQASLLRAGYNNSWGLNIELMGRPSYQNSLLELRMGAAFGFDHAGKAAFPIVIDYAGSTTGDLEIDNLQVGLHGVARLGTPSRFPLQVYGLGMLGGRVFSSSQTLVPDDDDHSECPESVNLSRSASFSYGFGGGIRIRFSENASLNLRATRMDGTGVRFVDLATVQPAEQNANTASYSRVRAARAQSLAFEVGFSIRVPYSNGCGQSCGGSYDDVGYSPSCR